MNDPVGQSSITPVAREPDPRFTLANERTFLAWIRTSAALLVTALAMDAIPTLSLDSATKHYLVMTMMALSILSACYSVLRWQQVQMALRKNSYLPHPLMVPVIALAMTIVALLILGSHR